MTEDAKACVASEKFVDVQTRLVRVSGRGGGGGRDLALGGRGLAGGLQLGRSRGPDGKGDDLGKCWGRGRGWPGKDGMNLGRGKPDSGGADAGKDRRRGPGGRRSRRQTFFSVPLTPQPPEVLPTDPSGTET